MSDDLRIFPDEFVSNVQASDAYKRWARSSPGDRARWESFRDALLANPATAVAPVMSTRFGKALVAAGKEHISISQLVTNPDPSPPPQGETLAEFLDFHSDNNRWGSANGDVLINCYQPRENYYLQPASATVPPWVEWANADGGIDEITTPYGPGFGFVVYDYMTVPSGGKMALIADVDWLIDRQNFLGLEQEWSGKFMFPASGNPDGFPTGASGLFWEFHTQSMSGNHISLDPPTQKISFGVYDPATQGYRRVYDSQTVQYDHWYSWRWRLRWSYGSDGYFQGWLDSTQIADFTGATIKSGESPYLQFGFYSHTDRVRNECHHADLRVVNPSAAP